MAKSDANTSTVTASPIISLEPKSKGAPNGWIVAKIPIAPRLSKSGQSLVIASTRGSLATDVEFEGRRVMLGLNAFVYEPKNGKGD